jgi:hypothetical protein
MDLIEKRSLLILAYLYAVNRTPSKKVPLGDEAYPPLFLFFVFESQNKKKVFC